MTVNISQVAAAYARAASDATNLGAATESGPTGESFGEIIARSLGDAARATRDSEQISMQAVVNQADLNDIVTAVTNAEITLQTVVSIRDRVIQAYQEILRMPI